MSVLDQIKKLDEQKAKLLADAKKESLASAEKAIADLNSLGFNYKLVLDGGTTRRTGIRKKLLAVIKKTNGIATSDIHSAMNADDKKAKQSVSNALAALKKSGTVIAKDGVYKVAS